MQEKSSLHSHFQDTEMSDPLSACSPPTFTHPKGPSTRYTQFVKDAETRLQPVHSFFNSNNTLSTTNQHSVCFVIENREYLGERELFAEKSPFFKELLVNFVDLSRELKILLPKWFDQASFECFLDIIKAKHSFETCVSEKQIEFKLAEKLLWISQFFKMQDLQRVLIDTVIRKQLTLDTAFDLITKTHLKLKNSPQIEQLWLDLLHLLVDYVALNVQRIKDEDYLKKFRGLPNSLLNEEIIERAIKFALHSQNCEEQELKNNDLLAACDLYLALRKSDAISQFHRETSNLDHTNLLEQQQNQRWTPMCSKKQGFEKTHTIEQNSLSWKFKVKYDQLQNQFVLKLTLAPIFRYNSEQRLLKCFPQLSPSNSQFLIPVVKENKREEEISLDIRESCQLHRRDESSERMMIKSNSVMGNSPRFKKNHKVKQFYAAVYGAPVHRNRNSVPPKGSKSAAHRKASISSEGGRALTPSLFSRANSVMSPSKVPQKTYRKNKRILTQQDQEDETARSNDTEKRDAFRTKIALLANVQVSIQGGSIISKTYPLLYSGCPVQFTLAKFQTLENLERVTFRYNLHLHYFGSALLNRIGRQLSQELDECKKLQKLALGELKAALGCQFFNSERANRSQGLVSILMKWVQSNQSVVLSQRRREFLSLLGKVNWAQVDNSTLLQMMRSGSISPIISKNMELLQKIKDELSKRAEASCLAHQNRAYRQTTRKPLHEEEQKTEEARLGDDEVSKDLRASSYEEVPSSALLSFNKSMNASGVDANQESIILPQVGTTEGMGSLESFTKEMKLAQILENSREKDTSDELKKEVERSSANVTLSSRENYSSSKSEFLEPPSELSDLLRKRKSTGRVTSAFLHRQRSSGGFSRLSSQFSPKGQNVSFIMEELKKRDEEIANLKMELLEVKKIQSEQQVYKHMRPESSNSSRIEAHILNYGDLENLTRMSVQEHPLNQNAQNFVTFEANTRESDISRINSASQLTTDGVSSSQNNQHKFNFPWSIFTNANRRSNQSLHSGQSGNYPSHPEFRPVSPFQPYTQSTFAERPHTGKTPTRLIKIQDLKENLPKSSESYETPARPLQPPPSAVNTTLRHQVKYLPNRSTSVRTNRTSNQIEPLLVNQIRETSPHQLISSIKMSNSERLQGSVSSFVKSPDDYYRGQYLKKRYQDVVGEYSESPAYPQISRTDTPQFQYQSVRNKH